MTKLIVLVTVFICLGIKSCVACSVHGADVLNLTVHCHSRDCDELSVSFENEKGNVHVNLTRSLDEDSNEIHRILYNVSEECVDFYVHSTGNCQNVLSWCEGHLVGELVVGQEALEFYHDNDKQCARRAKQHVSHGEPRAAALRTVPQPMPSRRYLELLLVNDLELFEYFNSSEETLLAFNRKVAKVMDKVYAKIDVQIVLKKVIIWRDGNKISRAINVTEQLRFFGDYANDVLRRTEVYDVAQLLSGHYYPGTTVGEAYRGTICGRDAVSVVSVIGPNRTSWSLTRVTWTMVHELGHNLGFRHDAEYDGDNKTNCYCKTRGKNCIMYPVDGSISWEWSGCSRRLFDEYMLDGMYNCLDNEPLATEDAMSICGNGVIEKDEECDCLPYDGDCHNCCGKNCTLIGNATCSSGHCCDSCQVVTRSARKVCRYHASECDKDERCDGSSEFCPKDLKEHDGKECRSFTAEGYCYDGQCQTHRDQCRVLFGSTSSFEGCRSVMARNTRGDKNGNCGLSDFDRAEYKQCSMDSVNCGQLHCKWRPFAHHNFDWIRDRLRQLSGRYHYSYWTINPNTTGEFFCDAVNYKESVNFRDYGLVADGTKCDDGKWCMNQSCVAVPSNATRSGLERPVNLALLPCLVILSICKVKFERILN